jgi:hypothetical protein
MRISRIAWAAPLGLALLLLVPVSGATAPVSGVVTTCTSVYTCSFVFNTSAGTGWAYGAGTGSYRQPGLLSFQLPGEAKASYNLSYSTYIGSLIGTYTYWTVGNFFGTDVNTGKVVFGTTDTNYTITCHGHSGRGGGCTYTYTTDNGTIVFHFTQAEMTSTTVSCTPTSVHVAGKTSCTLKVVNLWNSTNVPTGKVRLSSGGTGGFSNKGVCTLSAGQCTFTWHPFDNTCGWGTISAVYPGYTAFYKSSGSTTLTVTGGC